MKKKSPALPTVAEFEGLTIPQFFEGRSIFLTGASGFLGKVILEKLLRDCPELKSVYVLLRPKQGHDSRQRVEELLASVVFVRLRRENPSALSKVIAVSGDITYPFLGISAVDLNTLAKNVSVVFHSAATIRFDEPLKRAVDINVAGTKRVLDLCRTLPNLQTLLHVSTAYCNRTKIDIKEAVYTDTELPSKIIEAAQWMDNELLSSMSETLFNGRPSSYHYTKALAERLLQEEGQGIPIAIVRPSIITAAWKEPLPGWLDNYNGPTGYFVVAGKGILRSMLVQPDKLCDMIPVDVVANTCIGAAVMAARKSSSRAHPFVVNCTSGGLNPISWGRVRDIAEPLLIKHPSMEIFRYPGSRFHSLKPMHQLNVLIEHTIPSQVIDFIFKITGHKPILAQVYLKVHRTINALEYFTTNEWTYRNNNMLSLTNDVEESDRETFYADVRRIHWPTYMETYILGVRKFLLKEDPSTLPEARKRLQRIYYLMLIGKVLIVTVSAQQAYTHYPTALHYWARFGGPLLNRLIGRKQIARS